MKKLIMNKIVKILMDRDGMSRKEAEKMLMDAQIDIHDGMDPEEILEDRFGLEPDYLEYLV